MKKKTRKKFNFQTINCILKNVKYIIIKKFKSNTLTFSCAELKKINLTLYNCEFHLFHYKYQSQYASFDIYFLINIVKGNIFSFARIFFSFVHSLYLIL